MVHKRILIVEDEQAVRETMIDLLSEAGFEVEGAADGEEAIEKVRETGFNIVITDLKMPRGDGMHVLEQVKNVCNTTIVQNAWRDGAELTIHGWIFNIGNGVLKSLGPCVSSRADYLQTFK